MQENFDFGEDNTCAICFDDLTKDDAAKCFGQC